MKRTLFLLIIVFCVLSSSAYGLKLNLATAQSDIQADSDVVQAVPAGNTGTVTSFTATSYVTARNRESYVLVNLSKADDSIRNATSAHLWVYVNTVTSASASYYVKAYFCNDIYFGETVITWNNRNTQVTNCEGTAFYSHAMSSGDASGWLDTGDISTKIKNRNGMPFVVKLTMEATESVTQREYIFRSKEYALSATRPYFNITYVQGFSINAFSKYTDTPITTFNATLNGTTYSTTNGSIVLNGFSGTYNITIRAPHYDARTYTNHNVNTNIVSDFLSQANFNFIRESTNTAMNMSKPTTATLKVYCPNGTTNINVSDVTSIYTHITCAYEQIEMFLDYNGTTYARQLIPAYTEHNITFYLLDLTGDTGVQTQITLNDLTNQFSGGTLRVRKAMSGGSVDIIEQKFDVENKVVLYLLKDNLYTLSVVNSAGTTERSLGNIIASATSLVITFPSIEFYPNATADSGAISWSYAQSNRTTGLLRMQYLDTNNRTNWVKWSIYNGTNTASLIYTDTITGSGANNATISYAGLPNTTYYACLTYSHVGMLTLSGDCRYFFAEGAIGNPLEHYPNGKLIMFGICIAFILCAVMAFGTRHAHVGGVVAVFLTWMFVNMNWIPLNDFTHSTIGSNGIILVMGVIVFLIFWGVENRK